MDDLMCVSDSVAMSSRPVHELFSDWARLTPESVAIEFESHQLSYKELNEKSNQLAHHLKANCVARNAIIGLYMQRSIEMLIGILAILKAGAAYLPIDSESPPDRVSMIMEDARLGLILTHEKLKIPANSSKNLFLDSDWDICIAGCSSEPVDTRSSMDDLAYVLYTSGSTGKPKAVCYPHKGLYLLFQWMKQEFKIKATDVFLLKTAYTFDISTYELLLPLAMGSKIAIAKQGGERDVFYLHKIIEAYGVTIINFSPAMLDTFSIEKLSEKLKSLRLVIVSGEALKQAIVGRVAKRLPGCDFYNLYGMTEVQSITAYKCNIYDEQDIVSLGMAIANAELYVFDEQRKKVSPGCVGELYVGGDTVANGYLNNPQLTSEKFVPHPNRPQSIIYKTGDQVRLLASGALEYIGRLDNQIKVRGYRVELGEVEGVISRNPKARDVVVLACDDKSLGRYLVAYIVVEEKYAVSDDVARSLLTEEFRRYLRPVLPDYMMPSRFVFIDKAPLNANGKVDKNYLLAIS